MTTKIRLAVFASGSGTNAEAMMKRFDEHQRIEVALIVTNRSKAGVIKRAEKFHVPCEILTKTDFEDQNHVMKCLNEYGIDWIVLAGWLLLVPEYLVQRFPDHIVNIHPALLPKFGGKGMYGKHVHQAVYDNNERESGVTIHLVNAKFDDGEILARHKTEITEEDGVDDIEKKVRVLELEHYPNEIEKVVSNRHREF